MNKVFISYPAKSKGVLPLLEHYLQSNGIESFWDDAQEVDVGDKLSDKIREGVAGAACCILLLNEHTLSSVWCMAEAGAFWGANKPVLVYRLNPDCEIPHYLGDVKYAQTWAEIVDACKKILARQTPGADRDLPEWLRGKGLVRLFRIPDENEERLNRVKELLNEGKDRGLRLLASSGFSYLHPEGIVWKEGLKEVISGGLPFSVVLASPFSSFAETRALANWVTHNQWQEKGLDAALKAFRHTNVTIRVTEHPVECSLFLAGDSVHYDPYVWGRTEANDRTENRFWVLEFRKTGARFRDPYILLEKHFEFLWKQSTPLREFVGDHWTVYDRRTRLFNQKMAEKLREREAV
jgi:hypothetical protein